MQESLDIRAFIKTDYNAIMDTYLKSNKTKGLNTLMDKEYYFQFYEKKLKDIMENTDTKIKLAVFKKSPVTIFGYIIYSQSKIQKSKKEMTVHFIYTKYSYRKFGIAKHLFNEVTKGCQVIYTDHVPYNVTELRKINSKTGLYFQGQKIIYRPGYTEVKNVG